MPRLTPYRPTFRDGNRLTLRNSGAEYFPALLAAIDRAQDEIFVETYIFADDATGKAVAGALARAAQRGVLVHLLVDGFGARDFPHTLMPALLADGVQVLIYRQEISRFRLRRHRLRRLHRKLVVIDGSLAFVGGINIIDDLNTPHQVPPRYDYAVQVEGPLLQDIHRAVVYLWQLVAWANLRHRFPLLDSQPPSHQPVGHQRAAFHIRDNLRHRRSIEDAYLAAIADAREEVLIACAYFLPGLRFRRALTDAVARGVKVTVLLQGRVEYRLLHFATQALYSALLGAGIHIWEYRRSFMHAKVAVIDRRWATVGSSNIDPFSLLLARESNVMVDDARFAGELRDSLAEAMNEGAHQLAPSDWRQRPAIERLLRWSCYGLVRTLIGLVGYGGQHR